MMNAKDLRPARQLAHKFGVKSILFGQAGVGKTPLINTAPRPILLACENGLRSMSNSDVPTWEAHTPEKIKEFFDWFFGSHESKNFDTLAIDSGSQWAEIVLAKHLKIQKDGRKVYGELSREVMDYMTPLYFMQQKHIVVICKMTRVEMGKSVIQEGGRFSVETVYQQQPYFPGQDLNVKVPHLFDEILYYAKTTVAGQPGLVKAIRTEGTPEIMARDRSGKLAELEPPDLSYLFAKCM